MCQLLHCGDSSTLVMYKMARAIVRRPTIAIPVYTNEQHMCPTQKYHKTINLNF